MARLAKIEVSAINIRIPADKTRNYLHLINYIFLMRKAVKVYGNSFVAITSFDISTGWGIISKYSEIDVDGDWFDTDDFGHATPEKVGEFSIPETLRPNYSAFYFNFYEDLHLMVFETYSESKALSSRSIERYFQQIVTDRSLHDLFGRVEVDIVKSFGEIERILSLPRLKELRITIRRPNPDDLSGDLAEEIERRLREQNAEEYEEITRSKDDDGLAPNERTKRLASVGAENGEVSGKSIVNGVQVTHTTSEKPEKIVDTYSKDDISTREMFSRLSKRMAEEIRRRRALF